MSRAALLVIAVSVVAATDDVSMLQGQSQAEDSQIKLKVPEGATVVIAELGEEAIAPALRHHRRHRHHAKNAQMEAEEAPMPASVPVLASTGHARVSLRAESADEKDKSTAKAQEATVEKEKHHLADKDLIGRGQMVLEARRSADIANAAAKAAEAALVVGTKFEAARASKEAEEAAEVAQRTAAKAREEQKELFAKLTQAAEDKKRNKTIGVLPSVFAANASAKMGNFSYAPWMQGNGVAGIPASAMAPAKGFNPAAFKGKGKKVFIEDKPEPGFCCRFNMMDNCQACGLLFRASANSTCGRNKKGCEKNCGFNAHKPKWCPPENITAPVAAPAAKPAAKK